MEENRNRLHNIRSLENKCEEHRYANAKCLLKKHRRKENYMHETADLQDLIVLLQLLDHRG